MDESYYTDNQKNTAIATRYELQNSSELLNYINIDPEFRELVADLSGNKWDDKLGKYINDPLSKPLCNMAGIQAIISTLRAYYSKSAVINYLEDKDVNKIMVQWRQFIKKLIIYDSMREKYGIKISDRHRIVELLTTGAHLNLLRSRDGHEFRNMTQIVSSEERVAQTTQPKEKPSLFRLPFRKR